MLKQIIFSLVLTLLSSQAYLKAHNISNPALQQISLENFSEYNLEILEKILTQKNAHFITSPHDVMDILLRLPGFILHGSPSGSIGDVVLRYLLLTGIISITAGVGLVCCLRGNKEKPE